MAGQQQKNRDQQMAAYLLSKGITHGKRQTKGHCPICYNAPHFGACNVIGSTKLRRRKN